MGKFTSGRGLMATVFIGLLTVLGVVGIQATISSPTVSARPFCETGYRVEGNSCLQDPAPLVTDPLSGVSTLICSEPDVSNFVTCVHPAKDDGKKDCTAPYADVNGTCEAAFVDGECPAGGASSSVNGRVTCVQGSNQTDVFGNAENPANAAAPEPDVCPVGNNIALRWLYCPVFEGIAAMTGALDAFIDDYLAVGNDIYRPDNEQHYKNAWGTFRNFGIALVVIAGLIMLFSEALGLPIVDAYTVRKLLPKWLLVIVGVSLSWELCKFMVGLFDGLGHVMGDLIYTSLAPAGQGAQDRISIAALITTNLVGAGALVGAALLLGPIGLLSLLATLVLGMLIAAVVLVIRQGILIALIIIMPFAIATASVPGISKVFSFTWGTFWKLLALYPAITFAIALGKSLGNIILTNPGDSVLSVLIATATAIVVWFGGYASSLFIARAIGGVTATLVAGANDRTRGAFDRLKKGRQNQMAMNTQAMAEGRRFQNNKNPFSRTFNSATRGFGNFAKSSNKMGYFNKATRAAAATTGVQGQAAEFAKSGEGQALSQNDMALRMLTYGDEKTARANIYRDFNMDPANAEHRAAVESAAASVRTTGGYSNARAHYAAKQLFETGTGYDNAKQAVETANRVAGSNDNSYADIVGFGNSITAKAGRYGLKGGYGEYIRQRQVMKDTGTNKVSDEEQSAFYKAALEGNDAMDFVRGKPIDLKNVAPVASQVFADESKKAMKGDRQAAYEASRYGSMIEAFQSKSEMYGSPTAKQVIHAQMVNPTSGPEMLPHYAKGDPPPVISDRSAIKNIGRAKIPDPTDPTGKSEIDNPDYNPGAAAGKAEQGSTRYDPRNPYER